MPPLEHAVIHGDRRIVELLLDRGADLDATDDFGWTALTAADADENAELVELLLARGADPARRVVHGYTPLHRHARCGTTGAALRAAMAEGDVDPRDAAGRTPLMLAVRAAHASTAAELLAMGANPGHCDRGGVSVLAEGALTDAVGSHDDTFVRLLLDAGADPNPPGVPPLFACIDQFGESLPALQALLGAGADASVRDARGDTIVHRATQIGSDAIIEAVLGLAVSIEERDAKGRTPLLAVVHQENVESIRALLAAGAEPFATDASGASVWDLAATAADPRPILAALPTQPHPGRA